MNLEKLMPLFEELSADARRFPYKCCNERTKELADFSWGIKEPEDKLRIIQLIPFAPNLVSKLKHVLKKPSIKFKNSEIYWNVFHMSLNLNEIVLDPSYGYPVLFREYLPGLFDFSKSPATEVTLAEYTPKGVYSPRIMFFDSKGQTKTKLY